MMNQLPLTAVCLIAGAIFLPTACSSGLDRPESDEVMPERTASVQTNTDGTNTDGNRPAETMADEKNSTEQDQGTTEIASFGVP